MLSNTRSWVFCILNTKPCNLFSTLFQGHFNKTRSMRLDRFCSNANFLCVDDECGVPSNLDLADIVLFSEGLLLR